MQCVFERRCRQHGRGYLYIADEILKGKLTQGDVTYKVIEATRELMKKQQYHRCPGEADLGFINAVIKSNSYVYWKLKSLINYIKYINYRLNIIFPCYKLIFHHI